MNMGYGHIRHQWWMLGSEIYIHQDNVRVIRKHRSLIAESKVVSIGLAKRSATLLSAVRSATGISHAHHSENP